MVVFRFNVEVHYLDITVIVGFILFALYSGLRSRQVASENLEEYFLAGRSLKGWQAGLSMAATQFAADTPLLVTGLIATNGIFSLWQMWVYGIAFLALGFIFAPLWRRARVLTDAELTELRYGSRSALSLRIFKSIYFGVFFNCIVLAWVFFAAGKVAEPFLLWNEWLPTELYQPILDFVRFIGVQMTNHPVTDAGVSGGPLSIEALGAWTATANNLISIVCIISVATLYSTTGGLRAVVRTDVSQLAIMFLGTAIYAITLIYHVGGFGPLHQRLAMVIEDGFGKLSLSEMLAMTPINAADVGYSVFVLYALQWILQLNSDGTGYLAQRAMACRSDREAHIAGIVFSFVQILVRSLMWLPIGLALIVIYPEIQGNLNVDFQSARESTFVLGMKEFLPAGLLGIMLTGMLAALASTVDTHLNWGSSYITNDIYKRLVNEVLLRRKPKSRELVWVARCTNIVIVIIAFVVATQLDSIQQTWKIGLALGAGMGLPLVLRWFWWRMNAEGEIAAIVSSLISAPLLIAYVDSSTLRILGVAITSLVASLLAVFIFRKQDMSIPRAFYRQVQPPGFWGPFSRESKADRHRLWRDFRWTLFAAMTLFSSLLFLVGIMIQSPALEASWHSVLWYGFLLLLGVLPIPFWWQALRRSP